jgi:hypothetical protein
VTRAVTRRFSRPQVLFPVMAGGLALCAVAAAWPWSPAYPAPIRILLSAVYALSAVCAATWRWWLPRLTGAAGDPAGRARAAEDLRRLAAQAQAMAEQGRLGELRPPGTGTP